MKIRKAVIPAAGLGTRVLPATKAIPKEMLPIVDKPAIQYIVEEAVAAGKLDKPVAREALLKWAAIPKYFDRFAGPTTRASVALLQGNVPPADVFVPVNDNEKATNGAAIHLNGRGVPVIVIGIPVRYAHTHYGISAYSDFDNAVKLACAVLTRLNGDVIESF